MLGSFFQNIGLEILEEKLNVSSSLDVASTGSNSSNGLLGHHPIS
jgi:hypothetical protein